MTVGRAGVGTVVGWCAEHGARGARAIRSRGRGWSRARARSRVTRRYGRRSRARSPRFAHGAAMGGRAYARGSRGTVGRGRSRAVTRRSRARRRTGPPRGRARARSDARGHGRADGTRRARSGRAARHHVVSTRRARHGARTRTARNARSARAMAFALHMLFTYVCCDIKCTRRTPGSFPEAYRALSRGTATYVRQSKSASANHKSRLQTASRHTASHVTRFVGTGRRFGRSYGQHGGARISAKSARARASRKHARGFRGRLTRGHARRAIRAAVARGNHAARAARARVRARSRSRTADARGHAAARKRNGNAPARGASTRANRTRSGAGITRAFRASTRSTRAQAMARAVRGYARTGAVRCDGCGRYGTLGTVGPVAAWNVRARNARAVSVGGTRSRAVARVRMRARVRLRHGLRGARSRADACARGKSGAQAHGGMSRTADRRQLARGPARRAHTPAVAGHARTRVRHRSRRKSGAARGTRARAARDKRHECDGRRRSVLRSRARYATRIGSTRTRSDTHGPARCRSRFARGRFAVGRHAVAGTDIRARRMRARARGQLGSRARRSRARAGRYGHGIRAPRDQHAGGTRRHASTREYARARSRAGSR